MRISAALIDIDGVLTVSWQPLPGAVAALRQLRTAGVPLALVTNTTSRPRASIASALAGAGFPVTAADILTAPAIAAAYLNNHYPGARCLLLNSGDIGEDLAGVTLAHRDDPAPVDVVLVGGAGPEFTAYLINSVALGGEYGSRKLSAPRIDMTWGFKGYSTEPRPDPDSRAEDRNPDWRADEPLRRSPQQIHEDLRRRFWLLNVMLPHILAVVLGVGLFIAAALRAPGLEQLHL
jgi:hypothetical protein